MSKIKICEDQKWAFFFFLEALIVGRETDLFSLQGPQVVYL